MPKVLTLDVAETRPNLMGFGHVWFLKTILVEEWRVEMDWRRQKIMDPAC